MRKQGRDHHSSATRLRDLVAYARRVDSFRIGDGWSLPDWDVTELTVNSTARTAHASRKSFVIHFRQYTGSMSRSKLGEPFEEPFADFIKAHLTLLRHYRGTDPMSFHLRAPQCLYEALKATGTTDPTRLTREIFDAAADIAEERWTRKPGYDLFYIADLIDTHALTPSPISWNNRWPKEGASRDLRIFDGVDDDRMPSREALTALGELAQERMSDWDLALFRVVQLLVVGGFRLGEVLTLPADCWVDRSYPDPVTGKIETRSGVRYWPEKSGETFVKWLPSVAVEVARTAVDDLRRIGSEARRQAKRIERDPSRVPLPRRPSGEEIDAEEFGRLIGIGTPHQYLKVLKVKPSSVERLWNGAVQHLFKVDDIERALTKFAPRLIVYSGQRAPQMLSDSLCITLRNAFGGAKRPIRALPRLISCHDVRTALGAVGQDGEVLGAVERYLAEKQRRGLPVPTHETGSHTGSPNLKLIAEEMGVDYSELMECSAGVNRLAVASSSNRPDKNRFTSLFEKYGKTSDDGTPLKIRPHQLRHWVNTLAARGGAAGGMTLVEMSLWFGRRDLDETLQYVHLDLPARIRWLEREIEAGSVAGPFIDAVRSITDPEERRAFIRLHAGRVHITPYGLCIHDFDAQPCPYHLVCVKGCKMFIRIKGRQEQRRNIEALLAFEEEKIAQFAGDGAAENWIIDATETRDGCLRALAVDEDETAVDGTSVRVFPLGKVLGTPVE